PLLFMEFLRQGGSSPPCPEPSCPHAGSTPVHTPLDMDHVSLVIVVWHDGDGSGVVAAAICAATTSASAPVWFAIAASLGEEVASQAYGIVLRSGLDYLKIGRM